MGPSTLDCLPPEIILQVYKSFDDYTILTSLRPVCRSWCYAAQIRIPSGEMAGLPPAIWERIFSHNMDYRTLHNISQTCAALRSLARNTRLYRIQGPTFQLPALSASAAPAMTSKITQHPAFESICCRIETGSLIYHKSGNCCPNDVLSFPVAQENATNPPASKVLVKFASKYGVILRPVLIDRPQRENERGVTVGDVYKAVQRLFAEPLSTKQFNAMKQIRDWESRKHAAAKAAIAKIDLEKGPSSNLFPPSPPLKSWSPTPDPDLEEPVVEHDDSTIQLEYPFAADALPHSHNMTQRQREFLQDFPYVYASVHVGGVVDGVQLFNLTYH
ncbi:hypothetical protein TWF730_007093 [Orbilia blumenaviensis]|uniref:F-box domain-containing protein n=1 Tax=Orbilia blumenaviensis TaxID=1796055 RepID=A0AAV9VIL9_9PEZI